MKNFDETDLSHQMDSLSDWKVVGFTLMCCERMVPNFRRFSTDTGFGDESVLRAGLNAAWHWIATKQLPYNLESLRIACEKQAPDTENFNSDLTSAALDAANAVAILLEALELPSISKATEVAILSRDTIDLYIQLNRNLDPSEDNFETEILTDPFMQAELLRQQDDLKILAGLGEDRISGAKQLQKHVDRYAEGSLVLEE